MSEISEWFQGRLPEDWFSGVQVSVDREEILVVGTLSAPDLDRAGGGSRSAEEGRIRRFREDTRDRRIEVAREAEQRFGRSVAWGAVCGDTRQVFTSASVPVMTRLRQPERQVLDTLVDAGVARSRSEALGWCVRLVGQHQGDWIESLRSALVAVAQARSQGPAV